MNTEREILDMVATEAAEAQAGVIHPVPLIGFPTEIVFAITTSEGILERRFQICGGANFRVPQCGEEVTLLLPPDDPLRQTADWHESNGVFLVEKVCTDWDNGMFWLELDFREPGFPDSEEEEEEDGDEG